MTTRHSARARSDEPRSFVVTESGDSGGAVEGGLEDDFHYFTVRLDSNYPGRVRVAAAR